MRFMLLSASALALCLAASAATPALAQSGFAPAYPPPPTSPPPPPGTPVPSYVPPTTTAPPGANPQTGARPGNQIGTGMSMPMGRSASNIDQQDTRSQVAPNLPSPNVGPNASPVDYLRAAEGALASGRTGEAQEALEQAQTRLLDRAVPYGQTNNPSANPAVAQITQALQALAAGDRAQCMQLIQAVIPQAQAMER